MTWDAGAGAGAGATLCYMQMNDPFCEVCHQNSIVEIVQEAQRVCTNCGCVQKNGAKVRKLGFKEESSLDHVASVPWQLNGGRMPAASQATTLHRTALKANHKTASKIQNRMRNLVKKLKCICGTLEACKRIQERAMFIMFQVLKTSELKRIKKDELLCSVAIVFAAREARIQYTFREVAEACENVTRKEICRVYKTYERVLVKQASIASIASIATKLDVDNVKFSPMIPRFGSMLGLDFLEQKKVRNLFTAINSKAKLSTLNPITRLSVAFFICIGKGQEHSKMVAEACNVSIHTILKSTELVEAELV